MTASVAGGTDVLPTAWRA